MRCSIQLRRTNTETGEVDQVLVPCGATLADICSPCAERAKQLRGRPVPGRLAPGHRTHPVPAPDTDAQRKHEDRLAEALRSEPCSPTCANWLRYGIQPKNPRPGLVPGACKGKVHRRDHLGYAGRRVLVSRKWSGKTLADHRGDRRAWLIEALGLPATDPATYRWEPVQPGDDDYMPPSRRLLHSVADRLHREQVLTEAR